MKTYTISIDLYRDDRKRKVINGVKGLAAAKEILASEIGHLRETGRRNGVYTFNRFHTISRESA